MFEKFTGVTIKKQRGQWDGIPSFTLQIADGCGFRFNSTRAYQGYQDHAGSQCLKPERQFLTASHNIVVVEEKSTFGSDFDKQDPQFWCCISCFGSYLGSNVASGSVRLSLNEPQDSIF